MATELAAAYERIEELETTLTMVRAFLQGDDADPFDVIEKSVTTIDRALTPEVVV